MYFYQCLKREKRQEAARSRANDETVERLKNEIMPYCLMPRAPAHSLVHIVKHDEDSEKKTARLGFWVEKNVL